MESTPDVVLTPFITLTYTSVAMGICILKSMVLIQCAATAVYMTETVNFVVLAARIPNSMEHSADAASFICTTSGPRSVVEVVKL